MSLSVVFIREVLGESRTVDSKWRAEALLIRYLVLSALCRCPVCSMSNLFSSEESQGLLDENIQDRIKIIPFEGQELEDRTYQ